MSVRNVFVFRRCSGILLLRADGAHDTFRHSSQIVIWHEGIIKGDLSHAIMAENKGDEVCSREGSSGSKGSCEL